MHASTTPTPSLSPAATSTSTTTPSPGPTLPDPDSVTPGLAGFLVVFVLAVATWLLLRNMTGRLRRMRFREQERNRQDARARLAELIAHLTRPIKSRRATRPPRASKLKRLDAKKLRGAVKQGRGRPQTD